MVGALALFTVLLLGMLAGNLDDWARDLWDWVVSGIGFDVETGDHT